MPTCQQTTFPCPRLGSIDCLYAVRCRMGWCNRPQDWMVGREDPFGVADENAPSPQGADVAENQIQSGAPEFALNFVEVSVFAEHHSMTVGDSDRDGPLPKWTVSSASGNS